MASSDKNNNLPFRLTDGEYVIVELERSKIPYFIMLIGGGITSILFFITFLQMYSGSQSWFGSWFGITVENGLSLAPIFIGLSVLSIVSGLIAAFIYRSNRMFVTNEHIVRIKQNGLVITDKKIISHLNVEDVKARQNILGKFLGYGRIIISTEGLNSNYEINFIKKPYDYLGILTDTRDQYQTAVVAKGGGAIPLAEKR
jgi:hypothetical protein